LEARERERERERERREEHAICMRAVRISAGEWSEGEEGRMEGGGEKGQEVAGRRGVQ